MANALLKGHLMKKGTIMVLKRFVLVALGPLGLSALLVGPASADVPPPNLLKDVAACIAEHAPARAEGIKPLKPLTAPPAAMAAAMGQMITVPAPEAAGDPGGKDPQVAAELFQAMEACMYAGTGTMDAPSPALIDIDLAGKIKSVGEQLAALDPEADDYEAELAKVLASFSGPIIDAVVEEVAAQRKTTTMADAFNEAKKAFLLDDRRVMKDGEPVLVEGVAVLGATGAEKARYWAVTYGVKDDDTTSADESIPDDISYRLLAGVEYAWMGDDPKDPTSNVIIGVTISGSELVTDKTHDVTATTTIADLVGHKTAAMRDIARADAVLKADGTAKGILLTEREKSHLKDVVKFRKAEIVKIDATILTFETSTVDNRTVVAEYNTALSRLKRLLEDTTDAKKEQEDKNDAVVAALVDPIQHLDTLIALAGDDTARAERAKLIKSAYEAATEDSGNPASALLDELLYGEDSGQALVTAVSDTYSVAKAAMGAVDGNTAKNVEQDEKLAAKKMYIDSIGVEMGFNPATGMGTGVNGMSRIDQNEADIGLLDGRVTVNEGAIVANTTAIGVERGRIDQNVMAIETNAGKITVNEMGIGSNLAAIGVNTSAIDANATNITANGGMITDNRESIVGLTESLEVVRAGVAASMALAGMPAINGRGVSIGVGSFDGESAFAIGFQIQSDTTSFKVGVTSSGGATGASAGVGFQF